MFSEINSSVLNDRIYSILDNLRLFVNFFEHEMLISAFFGSLCIPLYLNKLFFDLFTVNIIENSIALFKFCNFHIAYVINVSGIFQNSRNI